MSGDMMPKQQYDFIKGIQDNMLEASNMTEGDAWRFGFLIWQHQEWICKYLIDRKTEPTISKMEQVDEPQDNADQHVQRVEYVESVEPMQTEREGER